MVGEASKEAVGRVDMLPTLAPRADRTRIRVRRDLESQVGTLRRIGIPTLDTGDPAPVSRDEEVGALRARGPSLRRRMIGAPKLK